MVNFETEFFHPATPVNIPVHGFGHGHRLRLVGIPVEHHGSNKRFEVNLMASSDYAFHFNPRFDEHCVVLNNTKHGGWQHEERYSTSFPFQYGKIFTLEFVATHGYVQVYHNGHLFSQFAEREHPQHINRIEIKGDVHIHSVHVSSK